MAERSRRRNPAQLSDRWLGIALAIAALASLLIFFITPTPFRIGCLVVIAVVTIVTAPQVRQRGGGWWMLLAAGALASIGGAILAQVANTLGGLIAVIGGVLVIVAATIGFPLREGDSAT